MTVLPVIVREMRAQARVWNTYWLRVAGAAGLLGVSLCTKDQHGFSPLQGGFLFGVMQAALFGSIWVLVPLMTADCISREKREGTLGLLFLTPLTAVDIALAKVTAHALRAFTLVLAGLPILAIPILAGGVDGIQLVLAAMIDLSALAIALAAGLVASARSKSLRSTQITALLLAAASLGILALAYLIVWSAVVAPRIPGLAGWSWEVQLMKAGPLLPLILLADAGTWSDLQLKLPASAVAAWVRLDGQTMLASVLLLAIGIGLASLVIRKSWREPTASPLQLRLEQILCVPRFWRTIFRNRMRRALEKNPVGWLERYSVWARLRKWGWCMAIIAVALTADLPNIEGRIPWAGMLLLGGLGLSAAASFRRERETGAFELLFVTPLTVRQIIQGRVRGIQGQFLPAMFVLLLLLTFCSMRATTWDLRFAWATVLIGTWLTLPVVGLYFSMGRMHWLPAGSLTCIVGLLFPAVTAELFSSAPGVGERGLELSWSVCLVFCAAFAAFGLTGLVILPERAGKMVLGGCMFAGGFTVLRQALWPAMELGFALGALLGLQLLLQSLFGWRLQRRFEERRFAFQ